MIISESTSPPPLRPRVSDCGYNLKLFEKGMIHEKLHFWSVQAFADILMAICVRPQVAIQYLLVKQQQHHVALYGRCLVKNISQCAQDGKSNK